MQVCCPADKDTDITARSSFSSDPETPSGKTLPEPGVCGGGFHNRIYGGNVTKIDEFPWMALIRYKISNHGTYM